MGFWGGWLGPRLYDPFLALGEWRGLQHRGRELLAVARGRVLEIEPAPGSIRGRAGVAGMLRPR